MKIVLLGAPLSGKGSQATLIQKDFNIPHISTGDLFREILSDNNSPLKSEIENYMNNGLLVPDEITSKLVIQKIKNLDGFILDGFPRTINQALVLDKYIDIDACLYLEDSLENILSRVEGRRVCPNCKTIFNKKSYKEDFCNLCQTKLVYRNDDNVETATKRYNEFMLKTFPLVNYYLEKGKLHKIVGLDSIDKTYEKVLQVLQVL